MGIASPTDREKFAIRQRVVNCNVDPSFALAIQLSPGAMGHGMTGIELYFSVYSAMMLICTVQYNFKTLYGFPPPLDRIHTP